MISQKFSQALAVECSFFAAVLSNLLWPWSLGDVTMASSKSTGTTREGVSSKTLRAHFQIFSLSCFSRRFDGDGGRYKLMIRKAASPLTSFSAPPRPASGAGGV